jgi:hypothetical protein
MIAVIAMFLEIQTLQVLNLGVQIALLLLDFHFGPYGYGLWYWL